MAFFLRLLYFRKLKLVTVLDFIDQDEVYISMLIVQSWLSAYAIGLPKMPLELF